MDRLNNATGDMKITLAGEDRAVIDGMANYMLARGANCSDKTSAGDRTQGVCVGSGQVSLVRSSLFAELEKAPGTADISVVLRLLGEEGGHPDIENSARRPLLILAARQGYAELVSILVTARSECQRGGRDFSQAQCRPSYGDAAERPGGGASRAAGVGSVSF